MVVVELVRRGPGAAFVRWASIIDPLLTTSSKDKTYSVEAMYPLAVKQDEMGHVDLEQILTVLFLAVSSERTYLHQKCL
jgi:hypothetical protein